MMSTVCLKEKFIKSKSKDNITFLYLYFFPNHIFVVYIFCIVNYIHLNTESKGFCVIILNNIAQLTFI